MKKLKELQKRLNVIKERLDLLTFDNNIAEIDKRNKEFESIKRNN